MIRFCWNSFRESSIRNDMMDFVFFLYETTIGKGFNSYMKVYWRERIWLVFFDINMTYMRYLFKISNRINKIFLNRGEIVILGCNIYVKIGVYRYVDLL